MTIVDRIYQETGVPPEDVYLIARSASHRYKTYGVQKRRGGVRQIAHPAIELKFLQRWLADKVLRSLPIHPSAMGYRDGVSIRDVALRHVGNRFLLIMDLMNFFESISRNDVSRLLQKRAGLLPFELDEQDRWVVANLLTRYDRLPIGAPSSPITSNAMLLDFDREVSDYCDEREISYSRYADDLHFSTVREDILKDVSRTARQLLRAHYGDKVRMNDEKTVFTSKKRKRFVVGLYLTSNDRISMGRRRKRHIRGMLWRYKMGRLDTLEASKLRGLLAFAHSVEPGFLGRLRRKYGDETIAAATSETPVSRK